MNTKIVVVTAKGKFEHEIDKPYISIGRSKDNDIIIDDLSVSRKHAILEKDEAGKFYLTDLNSSNGTFVNNVRITEKTPITTNDHILLGKATLVIEVPEDFQGTVRVDASTLQEKLKQQATVQEAVPTPPPVQQTPPAPPQPQQAQQPVTPPPVQAPPVTPNVPPAPKPQNYQEAYRGNIVYGSILQRFLALLIDGFILGITFSVINFIINFILVKMRLFILIFPVSLIVIWGVMFTYFTYAYSKYGTTIGKKIFKLYVVDQKKLTKPSMQQALIRTAVQLFLSGIFFIGYIMAFFNPEHTSLHDMLAKTYVIKK